MSNKRHGTRDQPYSVFAQWFLHLNVTAGVVEGMMNEVGLVWRDNELLLSSSFFFCW